MKPALLKLFLKPSSVSDGGFACRGSKKWKPHYLYRSIGHVAKWGPEKRIIDHFFFHNNYGQLSICFKRNFTMIETNWCSYVYLLSMFPHREQTAPHREQTAPFLLKKKISLRYRMVTIIYLVMIWWSNTTLKNWWRIYRQTVFWILARWSQ